MFAYRHGRTQIELNHARAPLKFQRPFYPEGSQVCHGVMLHTAGGMVGGDRLSFTIQLEPKAQALLTTAAASKIYRSAGATVDQSTHITVGTGGCLEWLPQETIVFNGAQLRQQTRIDLAENAIWIGWEITRLGRSARGERFQTGQWRSHTEVWRGSQPLWIDRQYVEGGGEMLDSSHGLSGYPVIGSFAMIGRPVDSNLMERLRQLWLEQSASGEAGTTRLPQGLLCRYRGSSSVEARRWFVTVWDQVRLILLNRAPCHPRVWGV